MKLYIGLLIVSVMLFSSCARRRANRYLYASQASNINYFKHKGDSKITSFYSSDGDSKNHGFNIQAGYALTKHIALMAAYTNKQEYQSYRYDSIQFRLLPSYFYDNIFDSSVIHYKRNTFEIGIGFFWPLDPQKIVTFNLYSGISFGKNSIADVGLDSNSKSYNRFYHNRITKYFVQGSFNIMPTDLIHLSFGGKISLVKYHFMNTSYASRELSYFLLDEFRNNSFIYGEPFFDMQIAIPKLHWIKMEGQISLAISGTGCNVDRIFNGSIGLTIEPSRLLKKKKN